MKKIEKALRRRSVVWISGVRRVGKTFLCKSMDDVEYFDCELPRIRMMMEDPESFLGSLRGKRIVLDEAHRLSNPSEILKIAADHFPTVQTIATGSSTVMASKKFKDTLTGRKIDIWLTPMTWEDLKDFTNQDIRYRLLKGGLPQFFLDSNVSGRDYQDWLDAYWAKDIQELFRIEGRHSFQKFLEMLVIQSGAMFEATSFAVPCGVSRQTISNYLNVLESTFVANVVRPYYKNRQKEIVAAPKVYAFDTGFVCYYRGWDSLRNEDIGILWEHFVLNEIHANLQMRRINYWRDKRNREVDFVIHGRNGTAHAIECKWSAHAFSPENLIAFRNNHKNGANFVVCGDVMRRFEREYAGIKVRFVGIADLLKDLQALRI